MAPTTEGDQLAFLKCCFKHLGTKPGDIPMQQVVDELNLTTIGAANKRFQRLMAEGTSKKTTANDSVTETKTKGKGKVKSKPKTTKKRKIEEDEQDEDADELNEV